MIGDAFSLPGFESRNNFAGVAFVPGSDAYVRETASGQYMVGLLGHADPRYFSDVSSAAGAARQLAAAGVGSNASPSPQNYAAFWSPLGGLGENAAMPVPPLPHPDASNQALGPNLGGADGVTLPGDMPAPPSSPAGGLLLLFGGLAVLLLLLRKK